MAKTICPDGFGLNYTLPMSQKCEMKRLHDGTMVQSIPKLIPFPSVIGGCHRRKSKEGIRAGIEYAEPRVGFMTTTTTTTTTTNTTTTTTTPTTTTTSTTPPTTTSIIYITSATTTSSTTTTTTTTTTKVSDRAPGFVC